MAALDFPASPSTNDIHTENGVSWKWNGSAWTRLGDVGAQGAQGAAGSTGAQGVQGAAGSTSYNAGTLDSLDSTQFLRSDANDTATGTLTVRDILFSSGYTLQRSNHHSGHLEGSYNNVGANDSRSNPIYSIGSNYNPTDSALSNFYGVGYTHTNASFISFTGASGWGTVYYTHLKLPTKA